MPSNLKINVNFVPGKTGMTNVTAPGLANYLVQDVGFQAGTKQQERLKGNLQRDFGPIVDRELNKMARQIATMGVGLANTNVSPPGTLSIEGRVADAMRGNSGPMSISSVTGEWRSRSKSYMRWKVANYQTRRWFQNTGDLKSALKKRQTYEQAYGGMSVKFVSKQIPKPAVMDIARSPGRPANRIITGRLEVKVLGRLSLSDLPGIGEQATYSEGLLSGFSGDIQQKLAGHKGKYRPLIEPFLTYYMNRRIPNAVFRKLEDSILG